MNIYMYSETERERERGREIERERDIRLGKITKIIVAVFPKGSTNRKSNTDDKRDHCQEKRRPSTYVEGRNEIVMVRSRNR